MLSAIVSMDWVSFIMLACHSPMRLAHAMQDPTRVQPHMKKCFEGIDKLRFEGPHSDITGRRNHHSRMAGAWH